MHEYSKQEEIRDISIGKPHLFILGAGASIASFLNGDKNGKKLPSMSNFINTVGLDLVFKKYGIKYSSGINFEVLYSNIAKNKEYANALIEINQIIFKYFEDLELPDEPTIYDYLVLSLRPKDIIATFNWDPFLYEALKRNHRKVSGPRYVFLHGSVSVGYCKKCKVKNGRGARCAKCGQIFKEMPLLYPISDKDYSSNPLIKEEWSIFSQGLKYAYAVTIFGYSAPQSDRAAINAIKAAWGNPSERKFEEIELINIAEEKKVTKDWSYLIGPYYHCRYYVNFFDSFLAKHPRRSCEALFAQNFEAKFVEENPLPRELNLNELQDWFKVLTDKE